jgi:hypothetical protein
MMISSGILRRRGDDYTVNNNLLQEFQRQLQLDIPIKITRCQLHHNYHNYFLSVGEPIHQMPNLQLQNKHRIQRNPSRWLVLIEFLIQYDSYQINVATRLSPCQLLK